MWTGLRERLTDHRGLATVRAEHATCSGADDAVIATFGWDVGVSSDLAVSVPIAWSFPSGSTSNGRCP